MRIALSFRAKAAEPPQSRSPLFLLLTVLLALTPALNAQDTGWVIDSIHVDYIINADRTIDVTEWIVVDFGPLTKHGIYRNINTRYRRIAREAMNIPAGTERVDLDRISVTDSRRQSIRADVTRGRDQTRIRIGDPDITVSGRQTYVINYRIERGVGYFDDHDEFYWQVTGTEWPVPITKASARVRIPDHQVPGELQAWCYAGWYESSSSDNCTAETVRNVGFKFTSGTLDPSEGFTLVAAFPKGIVPEPTAADIARDRLALWWPAALPLIALFGMLWRWSAVGREPRSGSIVPEWRKPELPAGLAGTLLDQRADMQDIIATILDLAVSGHITITEVTPDGPAGTSPDSFVAKAFRTLGLSKTDWEVRATGISNNRLAGHQRLVLKGILDGKISNRISDLHNDFYRRLPEIREAMYKETVTLGLFSRNPTSVRTRYWLIGLALLVVALVAGFLTMNLILGLGLGLSAIIVMMFANAMPAMTPLGARHWANLKGVEEYIRRADKLELEMRQAPRRTTELFEVLLPYAVALDVTDIWVDQFETVLASQPPTWYSGTPGRSFSTASFHSGLSGFQTAASRTLGSSPGSSSGSGGSSGGGSVGGGGGGGGGGSW